MKRAVFLDRDGTIVDDPGFLRDPASVHLLPGAAPALHRLQQLGLVLVVVSNQSGIGRGLITTTELDAVNREVARQLAHHGVEIGGWYHCPHLPDAGCDCRKPGTLLHREAARDLEIDLASSWWIGDRTSDLIPARELGGRGILVTSGHGQNHRSEAHSAGFEIATGISEAAEMIARDLSGALPAILPPVSYRVAVAVSGRGSNLLALAEALARAGDPARIVTVISDRDAAALVAARERGWNTHRLADPGSAAEWLAVLDGTETDLLVLAGYLRLVPPEVVMARRGRIINIHPALLPDFGGPGM
ncbi:MAG TPA: HAD-IIIA family hydrolase, partial [Gemmatimonadales bacterium]|nr:HAD-IIIA family hydrolase [Gemmatimonadales bacterium]